MLYPASIDGNYGNYGYVNREGQFVIEPRFSLAKQFREGAAIVLDKSENEYCYINETGTIIWHTGIKAEPRDFSGNAWYEKDGSYMFLRLSSCHEGLIKVRQDRTYGYIDLSGNFVIQPQFTSAGDFWEGMAVASVEDYEVNFRFGYIDCSGNWVLTPRYLSAEEFGSGLAPVTYRSQLMGYIDITGRHVLSPAFELAMSFIEGLAPVYPQNYGWTEKYGYIDTTGRLVIAAQFRGTPRYFSEGFAAASLERRQCGFIDREGNWLIEPQFDGVRDFKDGMAAVVMCNDDDAPYFFRLGYVNSAGQLVIPPQYSIDSSNFCDGVAVVYEFGTHKAMGIDKTGKCLWKLPE